VVDAIDQGRMDRSLYVPAVAAVLSTPCGLIFLYMAILKRKLARQAS
jgi:hypothetical protein